MTTPTITKIFIIGGTGAQGIPVVRSLVADGKYSVRILTRDLSSPRAQALKALNPSKVELVTGSFTDEDSLRKGYAGCDAAFVNIDGFNVGEKAEIYWAIRAYELAIEDGGIKFFVYGNLEFTYKTSGYKKELRTGHLDGKGRVGEWIKFQAAEQAKLDENAMRIALFTSGAYIEMVIAAGTPMSPTIEKNEKGEDTVTWRVPLTEEGAVPHVSLEDCGYYVRWLFDNPDRANGMDLQVLIDSIRYADLAAAFTKVTGKPARFVDVDFETYWKEGPLSTMAEQPAGYSADANDPATMSVKENFTGWWNVYRSVRPGGDFFWRDYALLDEIHPNRIRSAEDFFRREEKRGQAESLGSLWERVQPGKLRPILKIHEDGHRASEG